MKRFVILLTLLLATAGVVAAAPVGAAERQRCFPETGYCVSGAILRYWEKNGGLPVFGYPISEMRVETVENWSGPVQWFERDRLEDHGSVGVLAGRLGAQILDYQGRSWQSLPRPASIPAGCRFFKETGHTLCGTFQQYWVRNGGLMRFGYPISEPMTETLASGDTIWTGTVQYFERRRMELHPELAGTRYEVLLGLLGRDIYETMSGRCAMPAPFLGPTTRAYPDLLGCPAPSPQIAVPAASQRFERGAMYWVSSRYDRSGDIWVVFYDNSRASLVWQLYADYWREGDPVSGGEQPPQGLVEPIRGFGKLWRENQQLRETLGWAVEPERADTATVQYFQGGAWAVYRAGVDRIYIMRPDNRAEDIQRIR
ncbi:MAG: hypothetical protein HXY39_06520 [Chloroflexi bacterium]|nr:hypothetical protein [Chloroflexota bacterium]